MSQTLDTTALQRLIDKEQIRDAMSRYARGVDRGDTELVRSAYHDDAFDQHGAFAGHIDEFLPWVKQLLEGVDNSMHFLGQSLIEFAGPALAVVETYFVSRRLLDPVPAAYADKVGPNDLVAREGWGRYIDRFEKRNGEWKVAHRTVILEAASHSVALDGKRPENPNPLRWGSRELGKDRLDALKAEVFGKR